MVRLVWFCVGLLATWSALAQSPNSWIRFDQTYIRIPVAKDGMYRLTFQQLRQSGFPVEAVNPKKIQLFHRGVQQAILVHGEPDEIFDEDDFVEFYGKKNDGTQDAFLYKNTEDQPHKFYNLFNDTTSYFLTAGTSDGKRMGYRLRDDGDAFPEEPYHLAERLLVLSDDYAKGKSERDEVYSSAFETGEGWTSTPIRQGQLRDFTLTNIEKSVAAGPLPVLDGMLVGRNAIAHTVEVRVGTTLRLVQTFTLQPYEIFRFSEDIAWSDITQDGKLAVRINVPNRGYNDQVSVSYLKITFPQETDALGLPETRFRTIPGTDKKNLVVHNPPAGIKLFDITDSENVFQYETSLAGPVSATVDETSGQRLILGTNTFSVPAKLSYVKFRQFDPLAYNYIMITHPLVRKSVAGYADPVKAYADYRASSEGGGYDTAVVNIQQLYDQFNYGEKSPLAIYWFLKFLSASRLPEYLFLVGKGLEYNQKYYRTANSGTWPQQDLVPTGGAPGSDAIFSMGLKDGAPSEGIPTGRLPAMSSDQVASYLEKIKEMESAPYDGLWRKRILHLSGGIEAWEPAAFKGYLEDFQVIAEGPYLGGMVQSIAKQSRDVQVINIAEEVNNGLGLITFFGHSSTTTLDFDIGNVTNPVLGYNNRGKYPVLLMNGCDVGAFFLRRKLFGEDWILADKLGATGFIAHNAFALVPNLYKYSHAFYSVAYADSVFITQGVGNIKMETGRKFLEGMPLSIGNRSQVEQMILLGDPAMKLFGASKPDLDISENQISVQSFHNEPVTASMDSFAIKFIVRNLGMAVEKPYRVEVTRTFSDNTSARYDSIFTIPRNTDTLLFIVRRGNEVAFGTNHFRLVLDADEIIDELSELNNEVEFDLFIASNGTKNLYPSDFSIVRRRDILLAFQTTDLFSRQRDFIVQADTTNTFDSPYKQEFTVAGTVLANQRIELLEKDSLAYYWRTRLASPLAGESNAWTTGTFTYISDSDEGWAQVHFPQFLNNPVEGLLKDEEGSRITFLKSTTPVSVTTFGASSGKPRDSVSVKISGQEYNLYTQGFGCRLNTVNLIAFDKRSTTPYIGVYLKWYEINGQYGGRRLLCGREPFVINSFLYNEVYTGKNDLIDYVNNVADGDSVLIYTMGNANFSLWPTEAKNKIGELGVSVQQLDQLVSGEPVVIFSRKGSPAGSAKIIRYTGENPNTAKLTVNGTVSGGFTSGSMSTPLIGPATAWGSFVFRTSEVEPGDHVRFEIKGVTLNREEITLFEDAGNDLDLSGINAQQYPFLKVIFHTADELLLTSPQVDRWLVFYTPVAEGVLLPGFEVHESVTLLEGDSLHRQFRFLNISEKNFPDSLVVQSSFFSHLKVEGDKVQEKIKAPAPGDTTFFRVSRNTRGFEGWNDLQVFVNPRLIPEQYYDNNILHLRNIANVIVDEFSPVTEVTFDGKLIQNGEYVSPHPVILIVVRDENPFLFKQDTLGMKITLTKPCDAEPCTPEIIPFSAEHVSWHPASLESPFRVIFRPVLEDGTYILTVESADAKGNTASRPYSISFNVRQESGITFLHPYPNPFSREIHFSYVLSGEALPEQIQFDIYDITGRPVFRSANMQAPSIGNNTVRWQGNDQDNQYLKNGVYIYSFRVTIDGMPHHKMGKVIIQR